ncbi:hypothetical protein Tco_0775272, partial [Tanacetum coccineum]
NSDLLIKIDNLENVFADEEKRATLGKLNAFDKENCDFESKVIHLEKIIGQKSKDFDDVNLELSNKTAKFEAYFEKLEKTKVVLERQLARKVDDSKAEKDRFLKEINHLRTQLENLKGKRVETKFDNSSILGKPPLLNNERDQLLKQIASLESKLASQDIHSCQKEYHELRTSYNALKVKGKRSVLAEFFDRAQQLGGRNVYSRYLIDFEVYNIVQQLGGRNVYIQDLFDFGVYNIWDLIDLEVIDINNISTFQKQEFQKQEHRHIHSFISHTQSSKIHFRNSDKSKNLLLQIIKLLIKTKVLHEEDSESEEEIFTSVAWIRAFNINEPIYAEFCHEFYSTYEFDEVCADDELQSNKIIRFRLGGRAYGLTLLEFARRLGLYQAVELEEDSFNVYFEGGLCSDDNFNATDYWLSISREENLNLSRSHTSTIRNLILRVIHKMITYGLCQRTTGYDKVQKNDLWILSMFDARHQNGYANVAWFISKLARKCRVLTEDVVRSLSAPIYCRDLDTTTLRDLIDSDGKLIPEDPQPGMPRVGIPRPTRASMQDLYDRMGRMEIRQNAIERMEYRQSYHWDRYHGVFEHMAGVYSVPLQGAYNPPGYAQPQYDQYYQQYPPPSPQYQPQQQQDDDE